MAGKGRSSSKRMSAGRARKQTPQDEPTGYARVFLSYAHGDVAWMERFRRELTGALFKRATIWSDKDIDRGTDWEDRLSAELDRADAALVLATTDYLQSKWCRTELEYVYSRFKEGRIRQVFWVEVKPCAWKQTQLAAIQRSGAARSLVEIGDENERSREIVRIVEEICVGVRESATRQDHDLLTVKAILGDEAFRRHLSVESVISSKGDFAIVCRGRDGSQRDVAIKVMRWSPVSGILENLARAAKRRQELRDSSFIRLFDSFMVKSAYGDHLVLVMEYFEGQTLRAAFKDPTLKGRFGVDRTVTLVRRAAEALGELHAIEYAATSRDPNDVAEFGFGPMIPEHLFYDRRLDRVRFSGLSISNFAWDVLGWKKFAALVSNDSERYTAPEQLSVERTAAKIDKRKVDQYMLGQLAVEMLDGELPLGGVEAQDELDRKAELFDEPLRYAGAWKTVHPQLAKIVGRMLARNQRDRWPSMEAIANAARSVEANRRALAKASYVKWVDSDETFFKDFYQRFFASKVAKREKSAAKFSDRKQQHEKLRKGMAAVLNFYPGNEPTSLRYVTDLHRTKGVTEDELAAFGKVFMELLTERINRRDARNEELAKQKAEIIEAWRDLLDQVLEYFRERGV